MSSDIVVASETPAPAQAVQEHKEEKTEKTEVKEGLSKNALKRIKKQEAWLVKKEKLKEKRKEVKKLQRERKRARIEAGLEEKGPLRKRKFAHGEQDASKATVVIDLDFEKFMNDKEIKQLIKQVQNSYGANRRAKHPVQYYATSVVGRCKERIESMEGATNWEFHREERSFTDVFEKERIIYLSSDSENVLTDIDENKVYVIGGLVDHNQQKRGLMSQGLCHKLAVERGLQHARLPIGEVLAVNHVFEIILKFLETKDWRSAFLAVIPSRKGIEGLQEGEGDEGGDGEANDGEGEGEEENEGEEESDADDKDADGGEGEGGAAGQDAPAP